MSLLTEASDQNKSLNGIMNVAHSTASPVSPLTGGQWWPWSLGCGAELVVVI